MRYFFRTCLFIPFGLFVLPGCTSEQPKPGDSPVTPAPMNVAEVSSVVPRRDKVPNFSWKDSTGKVVDYDSFHGKVTLINFWATWCSPCKKELPDLVAISQELAGKGVKIIGVSQDRGVNVLEDVKSFVRDNRIPYQIVISTDELEEAFHNVRQLPTTFLVDGQGNIVKTFIGARSKEIFTQAVTPLLE